MTLQHPKRRFARGSLWVLLVLGLLGLALSAESYRELRRAERGGGTWCSFGELSSCEKAFQSEYSRLFGRPISLYGAATYFLAAAIAALGLINGGPFLLASLFHLGLLSFVLFGATTYFAWALFTQVKTLCVLCLGDYLVNFSIAAVAWRACWKLRLPYRSLVRWDLESLFGSPANFFRAAIMVGLFVVLGFVVAHQEKRTYLRRLGLDKAVRGELGRVGTPWANAFPSAGPGEAPIHVVTFGDYQCPYCAKAKKVWESIAERYPGLLRMTAVAAPGNSNCNPRVPTNEHHPFACPAAYLSKAVWDKGGENAFWSVHSDLYESGDALNWEILDEMGKEYGLSLEELENVRRKSDTPDGIRMEVQIAEVLGVGMLPYAVVNGMKISGFIEEWALLQIIEAELERKGMRLDDFEREA